MRRVTPAKKQHEALVAMAKRRGDHLESPPSLWKASGLEPSFMNFMVKTKGTLSCSLSLSLSVCLPPSLLSASQRQTPLLLQLSVFLASISRLPVPPCPVPPVLSLLCSENSGGRRPAQQQAGRSRRSTKEHTREQPEERRASGEWGGSVGRGGRHLLLLVVLYCYACLRRPAA
jgi:hypothetical protein